MTTPRAARRFVYSAVCLAAAGVSPVAADDLECTMEPHVIVNVSTAIEGILESVSVDKGDVVSKGQVIALLESDVEKTAVEQARARVEMESALKARQIQLLYAEKRLKRYKDMTNLVAPEKQDEAQYERDVAELELLGERDAKRLARLELQRVTALRDQRTIRSPITGVVMDRFLTGGEFAQAQPIVRLAQLDPLNVEVILPISMFGKVSVGMRAEVKPEEPLPGTYVGTVVVVERLVDAASGTFAVRVELANPEYEIPAGVDCSVRLLGFESR